MIYIPMLKLRQEEIRAAKAVYNCFSTSIIPLFEIIDEIYTPEYAIDPTTGDYLYEIKPGNTRKSRIKLPNTEADIITLESLNKIVSGKSAFVDYFRFQFDEFPNSIDASSIQLSLRLRGNVDLYIEKIVECNEYANLIPVISIKKGFGLSIDQIKNLITKLREAEKPIAIRITEEFIDFYKSILEDYLSEKDFFLFDIGEQPAKSKVIEFLELSDLKIKAHRILLNSPRKQKLCNYEYEEDDYTKLIDNSVSLLYSDYGFDGFGDYAGLRNSLPSSGGNGTGAALALMYDNKQNQFYSFCNQDTSLGSRGYNKVKTAVLNKEKRLNPSSNCLAYEAIKSMAGNGTFGPWNRVTLIRYIHQIYLQI